MNNKLNEFLGALVATIFFIGIFYLSFCYMNETWNPMEYNMISKCGFAAVFIWVFFRIIDYKLKK